MYEEEQRSIFADLRHSIPKEAKQYVQFSSGGFSLFSDSSMFWQLIELLFLFFFCSSFGIQWEVAPMFQCKHLHPPSAVHSLVSTTLP